MTGLLRTSLFALLTLVLSGITGCLPGDRRNLPRELFPSDSLSRQIAEATPVDTLQLIWRRELPAEARYPVTLLWEGDQVHVADLQRGGIYTLHDDGYLLTTTQSATIEYPLLIGASGDTVAVLSRGTSEVVLLQAGGTGTPLRAIPIPEGTNAVGLWDGAMLLVKLADDERGSEILALDDRGGVLRSHPLDPPFWRHVGFLREWRGQVVSLGGYRPSIRLLPKDARHGSPPDTLALQGFDSPQLERSRLFVMGDIREPPLLVPSAAPAGDLLFVLNARPGWTHVDVFAAGAEALILERSLLSPGAELGRNFFAADLAARPHQHGFDLMVLETRPRPAVARYRWTRTPS